MAACTTDSVLANRVKHTHPAAGGEAPESTVSKGESGPATHSVQGLEIATAAANTPRPVAPTRLSGPSPNEESASDQPEKETRAERILRRSTTAFMGLAFGGGMTMLAGQVAHVAIAAGMGSSTGYAASFATAMFFGGAAVATVAAVVGVSLFGAYHLVQAFLGTGPKPDPH